MPLPTAPTTPLGPPATSHIPVKLWPRWNEPPGYKTPHKQNSAFPCSLEIRGSQLCASAAQGAPLALVRGEELCQALCLPRPSFILYREGRPGSVNTSAWEGHSVGHLPAWFLVLLQLEVEWQQGEAALPLPGATH